MRISFFTMFIVGFIMILNANISSVNSLSNQVILIKDSTDSVVEVNLQAGIKKFEDIISGYYSKCFSRDSLSGVMEQALADLSKDSSDIRTDLERLATSYKVGDSGNNRKLLNSIFSTLGPQYSRMQANQLVFSKANQEMGVKNNSIEALQSGHAEATEAFSKLIPENYTGKLHLVFRGNAYTVFVADSKQQELTITKSNTAGRTLFDAWSQSTKAGKQPLAIFNGGMFNPDYSPTGLLVENYQKVNDVNAQEKGVTGNFYLFPNGIFFVDSLDHFFVSGTKEFLKKHPAGKYPGIKYATQSGPMLLTENKIHKAFTYGSSNLNIRNAVGVNSRFPNKLFLAISDDRVNFYDFAIFFKEFLKCNNALYLDGVVSRMYIDYKGKKAGRLDKDMRLGPIISINSKARK